MLRCPHCSQRGISVGQKWRLTPHTDPATCSGCGGAACVSSPAFYLVGLPLLLGLVALPYCLGAWPELIPPGLSRAVFIRSWCGLAVPLVTLTAALRLLLVPLKPK